MILRIVSVSGCKDSTALYCWAIEQFGREGFKAVFADTGHEHPVTYNYVRNLPQIASGPKIHWVKADFTDRLHKKKKEAYNNPFLDLCLWKGRVPSSRAQFCTEHLKLIPIKQWLEQIREHDEVIMYTGIRAGESLRRSKMSEKEYLKLYDCETIRPLLKWTEEEIFNFLESKNVPPNPLYGFGFSRVGCFPCIHARKSELAKLPDWAWNKLEEWEKIIGQSWFPAGLVPGVFIPKISDVREWAKTIRGGRMFDLFSEDAADIPSCVSTWGICE
jgi:3'-phosphoadenosine 5'-phosphosulfate sulfotransferase (PAPS reductase)/FAD synthetase